MTGITQTPTEIRNCAEPIMERSYDHGVLQVATPHIMTYCMICKQENGNRRDVMTIDRFILGFAGAFVLVTVLLSVLHSGYWLILTAFVGANLLQASITGFCPMAMILKKVGVETGAAFK